MPQHLSIASFMPSYPARSPAIMTFTLSILLCQRWQNCQGSPACLQADPARVRQQLLAEGLELEEAGGDVQVVETAAPVGLGLAELEDALLLQVSSCCCAVRDAGDAVHASAAFWHVRAATVGW